MIFHFRRSIPHLAEYWFGRNIAQFRICKSIESSKKNSIERHFTSKIYTNAAESSIESIETSTSMAIEFNSKSYHTFDIWQSSTSKVSFTRIGSMKANCKCYIIVDSFKLAHIIIMSVFCAFNISSLNCCILSKYWLIKWIIKYIDILFFYLSRTNKLLLYTYNIIQAKILK